MPLGVPANARDPDDDQVLAAGVAGDVEAIVTGDKDLLELENHRGLPILTPADSLTQLNPPENGG